MSKWSVSGALSSVWKVIAEGFKEIAYIDPRIEVDGTRYELKDANTVRESSRVKGGFFKPIAVGKEYNLSTHQIATCEEHVAAGPQAATTSYWDTSKDTRPISDEDTSIDVVRGYGVSLANKVLEEAQSGSLVPNRAIEEATSFLSAHDPSYAKSAAFKPK